MQSVHRPLYSPPSVTDSPAILSYAPPATLDPEGAPVYIAGEKSINWMHLPAGFLLLIALMALMFFTLVPRPRAVARGATQPVQMDPERLVMRNVMIVTGTLSLALFVYAVRRPQRSDIQPDILQQIFPPQHILKIHDAHAVLGARQSRDRLKLFVVIQNRREGPGKFRLNVASRCLRDGRWPALECSIPGGGVVIALCAAPLKDLKRRVKLPIYFRVRRSRSTGPVVRFAAHRVAGDNLVFRAWGGKVALQLVPLDSHDRTEHEAAHWSIETLWTPNAPAAVDEIAQRVSSATSATG